MTTDTIIASVALIVSFISLFVTYRSTRHQIISTILSHLNDKSNEINSYIQNRLNATQTGNYDGFTLSELDLSHIGSNVVTSAQLVDLHFGKHEFYLSRSDKEYVISSFYLQLHVTIRTKLWEVSLDTVKNSTIKQQLTDSRKFLEDAKRLYK